MKLSDSGLFVQVTSDDWPLIIRGKPSRSKPTTRHLVQQRELEQLDMVSPVGSKDKLVGGIGWLSRHGNKPNGNNLVK